MVSRYPNIMGKGFDGEILIFLLILLFQINGIYGRGRYQGNDSPSSICPSGSLYWPDHDQCYEEDTRGPCKKNHILIRKPEGPMCIRDYRRSEYKRKPLKSSPNNRFNESPNQDISQEYFNQNERGIEFFVPLKTTTTMKRNPFNLNQQPAKSLNQETVLPEIDTILSPKEKQCFLNDQIFWEPDNECYSLLTQGPCQSEDEWLILKDGMNPRNPDEIHIICEKKECPCTKENPQFCEVKVRNSTCPCKVALAAYQDGICRKNEQLVLTPFGDSICGCKKFPFPHIYWEADDACYEIYSRGPCPYNHTIQYDISKDQPLCVPELCPTGMVLYPQDSRCYVLGRKGPCRKPGTILQIHPLNKNLVCAPLFGYRQNNDMMVVNKRVFDIIPMNALRQKSMNYVDNSHIRGSNCILDSNGGCRGSFNFNDPRLGKRPINNNQQSNSPNSPLRLKFIKRRPTPDLFLIWLRSFKRN